MEIIDLIRLYLYFGKISVSYILCKYIRFMLSKYIHYYDVVDVIIRKAMIDVGKH